MHFLAALLVCVAVCSSCAVAQDKLPITADDIMKQVAANQDRAEASRRQYIYKQHVRVASRKTNGKLMREEATDYDVFPGEQRSSKKLTHLVGRYWQT